MVLNRFHAQLLSFRWWLRRLVFWFIAVGVGVFAVCLAMAGEFADSHFQNLIALAPYWAFVLMPLGFIAIVFLQQAFFPGSEGSGIPQASAALVVDSHEERSRLVSLRIAFGKFFLTVCALFSGASVGREGPTAQISASLMYSFSRVIKVSSRHLERGLIMAGGSAGIAAAFNTPIAGIVFAIEELSHSFEHELSGTILTTVVLAGLTSVAVFGDYTYFGVSEATLDLDSDWVIAVLACGFFGGLLGGLFSRFLLVWVKQTARFTTRHPYLIAGACGLILACIGALSGHTTSGSGYEQAKHILLEDALIPDSYGFYKMAAVWVSYISGIAGGIFAPTLSAGAGLGQFLAHHLTFIDGGAIVVLTMVAYFCGVVQSPITCFVIVNEMINSHDMVFPVMAASLIAWVASRLVCPKPLYVALAERYMKTAKAS